MTSVIDSSRRSGSSGPRPMISSVICSSIRTRSARVRARPSSSMTLPKISSIWRRTSTWLDRSSFGSRSWMTRFWIRNLTSRNDSRTGAWLVSRGRRQRRRRRRRCGRQVRTPGAAGAGARGPAGPGRALSIRFSRDIAYTPSRPEGPTVLSRSAPCEQRFLLGRPCAASSPTRPAIAPRRPTGPVGGCPGTPGPPG